MLDDEWSGYLSSIQPLHSETLPDRHCSVRCSLLPVTQVGQRGDCESRRERLVVEFDLKCVLYLPQEHLGFAALGTRYKKEEKSITLS
ncbi:hypothetical protein MHYP_G00055890 [Metynnis hypsauchen]